MYEAGNILEAEAEEFQPLDFASLLTPVSSSEARLSRGFLRAEFTRWFPGVAAHWLPLLQTLGASIERFSVTAHLEFPAGVSRLSGFIVDGEECVLGWGADAEKSVATAIAPEHSPAGRKVIIEYFERRLCSTLTLGWAGGQTLDVRFDSSIQARNVEVASVVRLSFVLKGVNCDLWFGLGPRTTERFDILWKSQLFSESTANISEEQLEQVYVLSVQIAEMHVAPVKLIEYMKPGTLVQLPAENMQTVQLLIDQDSWARGELRNFDGKFAAEISELSEGAQSIPGDKTRVQLELINMQMSFESLLELEQIGAILMTKAPLKAEVGLIIGGEHVARGVIGQIGDHLALRILPKY